MLNFPLIANDDKPPVCPKDGKCPMCGRDFAVEKAFVYVMGGAVLEISDDADLESDQRLEGFLVIGIHGTACETAGPDHIDIVDHVKGGQFDINTCSVECLEALFAAIVEKLKAIHPDKGKCS
jgi:hypothetical protein